MTRLKWLTLFTFLAFPLNAEESLLAIHLSEKSAVVGPQVSLGEVAELTGNNEAMIERVRRLVISRAAPAGERIKISQGYIKIVLRREGFSLEDFTFDGADTTEVLTQSQDFFPGDLLPDLKSFILKELDEPGEDVEVKLEGPNKKMLLPAGKITENFRPSFSGKYDGEILLTAELEVDGHLIEVLPLRLTVDIYRPAVITTKRVEKGEEFTARNIALVREPSSKIMQGCFRQLNYVLGRRAAIPLIPDTVIRINEIFDPPVVLRGKIIQAIIRLGNVELTVDARAMEDGKAGDVIRVENSDSHKVLQAKVLDEKTVLIQNNEPKY
jgi:flagellar basal body P-ring formation protein FlgA